MKRDPWEHSKRRGLNSYDNPRAQGGKTFIINCVNCGRYLGESNTNGQIAGKFPCPSCKKKTEV